MARYLQPESEYMHRLRQQKGALVAAHRGTGGGNIVQNTIGAYRNALMHGADMVEIDAAMTTDGVFYCFHDGQEPQILGVKENIRTMTSKEVEALPLINSLNHAINKHVNRVDDALEALRGKCLINIDRAWFYWKEIIQLLVRHDMADQIVLKSPVKPALLQTLVDSHSNLMYMPITYSQEDIAVVASYDVNFAAAELIFEEENNTLVSPDSMARLHEDGLLLWVNAITLHDKVRLCAQFDDDHAVMEGPDNSWGWLIRRGFDILQTDWPAPLRAYIDRNCAPV